MEQNDAKGRDLHQELVLVCAATGIRQQFYWAFSEWLATQGYTVLTFDYRGIGASLGTASVRHYKARKQDWAHTTCFGC